MVIIQVALEAVTSWRLKVVLDREAVMKGMTDSGKVLDGKTRDMGNRAEFRDGCINCIEIKEVTSVDAPHESLEMSKFEITEEQEFTDITGPLHEDDGGIFGEIQR